MSKLRSQNDKGSWGQIVLRKLQRKYVGVYLLKRRTSEKNTVFLLSVEMFYFLRLLFFLDKRFLYFHPPAANFTIDKICCKPTLEERCKQCI